MKLWTMHASALDGIYQSRVTALAKDKDEAVDLIVAKFEEQLREELMERNYVLGISTTLDSGEVVETKIRKKVEILRRLVTKGLKPVKSGVIVGVE